MRRTRIPAFIAAGIYLVFAQHLAAAGREPTRLSPAELSLVAADSQRFRAMVTRDFPTLARMLADELVYVHSSSARQNKSEHLHDMVVGKAFYRRIGVQEQQPRVYGHTGVIQGIATFTTGADPHQTTFTLRYTDVYVNRAGRWQMVAWHCTRMPDSQ